MIQSVTIVHPRRTRREAIEQLVVRIASMFLSGWFVMLLLPVITTWHPSYWQSVAFFYLAIPLQGGNAEYLYWSRARRKGER